VSLTPGTRLGSYEVVSLLGAGGMGEVYRARDSRLHRDVAVKVLPESVAADADRLVRFEREAQTLAALNHPNIAQIYGFEGRAIAMELVEGPTLSQVIRAGRVPLADALGIAHQIADALEAAHDRGIVHRDLKPDNIKLAGASIPTPPLQEAGRPTALPASDVAGCTVKVLDFGLAKALEPDGDSLLENAANSPTITARATQMGVIIGTAAYMAPEQARGRPVDRRADVWAFGVVLAEMLTGDRLFKGEDVSETLALVLARDPDLSGLPADTPIAVRRLIARCLEKDPKRRLRDIGDAMRHLEDGPPSPAVAAQTSTPRRRSWLPWAVAGIAVSALAAVGFAGLSQPAPRLLPVTFSIHLPEGLQLGTFAVAPDGSMIAFTASSPASPSRLWIQRLDTLAPEVVAGSDGAVQPFWSPDGTRVGFVARGNIKTQTLGGGPAVVITDTPAGALRGASWGAGGDILLAIEGRPLNRVPASGGTLAPLTSLGPTDRDHTWPQFLPGGRDFLVFVRSDTGAGTYRGTLDDPTLSLVLQNEQPVRYVAPGHLVFLRGDTLLTLPYVATNGRAQGDPVPIATGLSPSSLAPAADGSVSTLAWSGPGRFTEGVVPTWFDGSGVAHGAAAPAGQLGAPAVSDDGRWLAGHSAIENEASDIWALDLVRGGRRRLTTDPAADAAPVWEPGGRRLAFASTSGAALRDLFTLSIDADMRRDLLLRDQTYKTPMDWSVDGSWLIYQYQPEGARQFRHLAAIRVDGDRTPVIVADGPFNQGDGHFSPDGRWVAFSSNETGRLEVYVQAFPSRSERTSISVEGGQWPTWRADGRELYFLAPNDRMMAVSMDLSGGRVVAGTPRALFQATIGGNRVGRNVYDIGPDGRFLILSPMERGSLRPSITALVNWREALAR